MENLTGQATTTATNTAQNAQATATNAVGNAQATATNAVGNATSAATNAVGELQSKIPAPPQVPQLPKLPNVPQLPGVPEFKQKELPVPKKFKNSKFKDKLAAASEKAKQLVAKGQATATAEKAKQSAQDEIKKAQEGNGGKPLTETEKDKIVIKKTTEVAEKDAKPTQDAAKAALEKSNETIGKPDLTEPKKFFKSHTTPEAKNKFYIYQERDKFGIYTAIAYRNQNGTGYVTNRAGGYPSQGVDAVIEHLNQREDDVPEND